VIFMFLVHMPIVVVVEGQNLSPGGQPMLIVGIFQQCLNDHGVAESKLCQAAVQHANDKKREFWKLILEKAQYKINNLMKPDDFLYIHKTFCSYDEGTRIYINLKLDHSYFVKNRTSIEPKWNRNKINNWETTSRITYVMLFVSNQMAFHFRNYFVDEKFIVAFLNQNYKIQSDLLMEKENLYTSSNVFDQNAKELLVNIDSRFRRNNSLYVFERTIEINYFGVLYISSDSVIYQIEFEYFKKHLLEKYEMFQKCFFFYELNISDHTEVNNLLRRMDTDKALENMIVIGEPTHQTVFYNQYLTRTRAKYLQMQKMLWVFFDLDKNSFNFEVEFVRPQHVYSFNYERKRFEVVTLFNKLVTSLQTQFLSKRPFFLNETAVIKVCSQTFNDHMLRMMQIIHLYEKFNHFKYYTFAGFKKSCLKRFKLQNSGLRQMTSIITTMSKVEHLWQEHNIINIIKNFKCPVPHCGEGHQRFFGQNEHPDRKWRHSYGWSCVACTGNHFKSNDSFDNTTCLPCPPMTLSTANKSRCYDPYQEHHVDLTKNPLLVLSIATCVFGFIFCLIAVVVFFMFRTTPFVKASDLQSSCLHLVILLLFFASFPYLFIGRLNYIKCLIQPISILLFCICPSTLIVMKSQKILLVFKSKTRLTSSEKLKFMAKQYAMSGITVLINSSILIWTIISKEPQLLVIFDHENYTKRLHCNTGYHTNIQIMLLILQQFFSMVQAFRGRNLPGPFNEAMSITYSSFISVISYSIIFPIYYLQEDINVKGSIHLLVVPIVHVCFIFVFYGSKLYVILFLRNQNTKAYFQAEMMAISLNQVNTKMSNQRR